MGSKYCKFPIAIPNESAVSGPLKFKYSIKPYMMNKKAGVENFVVLRVGNLLMINDQIKAPPTPKINDMTRDEINWERTVFV